MLAPQSGLYTFYTYSYDGACLWAVNGQQLIGDWDGSGSAENTIYLQGGQPYALTMQYNEGADNSSAYLEWSYPGQDQQVIPQSQLYGIRRACSIIADISNQWPVGTLVANLLGAPGEANVTLSYAFVPGAGGEDNSAFTINGSTLLSAVPFNYAVQNTYHILIGVTNSNGLYSEIPFTLYVFTPPTLANAISNQYVVGAQCLQLYRARRYLCRPDGRRTQL